MNRQEFVEKVFAEVERAYAKHGREQWGRHEFYAIIKEEFDEVWDDIKADQLKALSELTSVEQLNYIKDSLAQGFTIQEIDEVQARKEMSRITNSYIKEKV